MGCGASSMAGRSQKKSHNGCDLILDNIRGNADKTSDSTGSSAASITTLELRQWTAKHRLASRQPAHSPTPAAVQVEEGLVPIVRLNFVESPGTSTIFDSQRTSQLTSPLASTSSRAYGADGENSSRGVHSPFLGQFDCFPEGELPSSSVSSTPRHQALPREEEEESVATLITSLTNISAVE